MKGTVKFFNDRKGYGFLTAESIEEDIFVHHSAIVGVGFKTLIPGQTVDFDLDNEADKVRAASVWRHPVEESGG